MMSCSWIKKRIASATVVFLCFLSLTIVYLTIMQHHVIHGRVHESVDVVEKESSGLRAATPDFGLVKSTSNITNTSAWVRPIHRITNKDEIYRIVSELWHNATELDEARIRERRKEIEENPGMFSPVDLRLFLRTIKNETAAKEIKKIVSKTVARCQAMQIVRSHVPYNSIILESDIKAVVKTNQSDCVPVYDSCSIVGNSGILLGSECGPVIDSADFVIRNNLPTVAKRFERDVGMRVDVMSINLELIRALDICTKTHKGPGKLSRRKTCGDLMEKVKIFQEGRIFWFFKRYTKLFKEMKAMLTALQMKHKLNFRFGYSPIIPMDTAKSLTKVPVPSSGLAVYVAATQFCKSVNLFGFYPFNDRDGTGNDTVMAHYDDVEVYHFGGVHRMPKEYAWLEELDKRGALRLINDCTSL